jgi:hypothetical protein
MIFVHPVTLQSISGVRRLIVDVLHHIIRHTHTHTHTHTNRDIQLDTNY